MNAYAIRVLMNIKIVLSDQVYFDILLCQCIAPAANMNRIGWSKNGYFHISFLLLSVFCQCGAPLAVHSINRQIR
ncbi:hypothetical protein JAB9_06040 [Janthinobacterium sp. HH107]|nr:hypothetical protein JAB9_06040 [Janthinobacterium sp. HH107]